MAKLPDTLFVTEYIDTKWDPVSDRKAFVQMSKDAQSKQFDLIYTWSVEEFQNTTKNTIDAVNYFRKLGIDVFFSHDNLHSMSQKGEQVFTVLSKLNESDGMDYKTFRSHPVYARLMKDYIREREVCYGYTYDPVTDNLVINEKEADAVRLIFNRYCSGESLKKIVSELYERNYLPKAGTTIWHKGSIRHILMNRIYVGDVIIRKVIKVSETGKKNRNPRSPGEILYIKKDSHEPIIDRELFDLAWSIREKRAARSSTRGKTLNNRNMFYSRMLECGFCGSRLYAAKNKKLMPYRYCPALIGDKNDQAYRINIPENLIDRTYLIAVESIREAFRDNEIPCVAKETMKRLLEKRILQTESNIQELISLVVNHRIDATKYKSFYLIHHTYLNHLYDAISRIDDSEYFSQLMVQEQIQFLRLLEENQLSIARNQELFRRITSRIIVGKKDENEQLHPYHIKFLFRLVPTIDTEIYSKRVIQKVDPYLVKDTDNMRVKNIVAYGDDVQVEAMYQFALQSWPGEPTLEQYESWLFKNYIDFEGDLEYREVRRLLNIPEEMMDYLLFKAKLERKERIYA